MSILIDMKMPEKCLECPLYDNYNYYCTLYSFGIPARHNRDGSTRPEWCELKELPECEDAISRQAAIDVANAVWSVTGDKNVAKVWDQIKDLPSAQPERVCVANITLTDEQVKKAVEKAKNAVVSVIESEQRWIPCSERLPNSRTEVIVSCRDDSADTIYRYTASGWITTDGEYWIVDNEINPYVIAWMPLPEPYKEEGESE